MEQRIIRIVRKDSSGMIGWKAYLTNSNLPFTITFTQSLRFGAPVRILAAGQYAPVSRAIDERLSLQWIRDYLWTEGYTD